MQKKCKIPGILTIFKMLTSISSLQKRRLMMRRHSWEDKAKNFVLQHLAPGVKTSFWRQNLPQKKIKNVPHLPVLSKPWGGSASCLNLFSSRFLSPHFHRIFIWNILSPHFHPIFILNIFFSSPVSVSLLAVLGLRGDKSISYHLRFIRLIPSTLNCVSIFVPRSRLWARGFRSDNRAAAPRLSGSLRGEQFHI